MINEKNIFEKGMLITLNAGSYAGRKKLTEEQLKGLPREIVRGVHDLFGADFKALLRKADNIVFTARDLVKRVAVAFPIDGVYFLRDSKIKEIVDYLDEKKIERDYVVDEIVASYDEAVKEFANAYPDYYAAAEKSYPPKERIKARFYFDYKFVKISAPDNDNQMISSGQYKAEIAKFKNMINEMKEDVAATVYQTLLETIDRLKSQSDDGKINQATLNSIDAFVNKIDEIYIDFIDRKDMKQIVEKTRAQIFGMSAKELKASEELKQKFGKELAALATEIKAIPNAPLKRAIEF